MKIENNSHYLYRILFTIFIFMGHAGFFNTQGKSYYIGVEYFFITSGFFIAYTVETKHYEVGKYIVNRIRKFWPHQLLSFLMMWLLISFQVGQFLFSLEQFFLHLTEFLPCTYFISSYYNPIAGNTGWNFPTWYLSELLIWGSIIYYMLKKHREFFIAIAPMVICISYAVIVINNPILNSGTRFGDFINTFDLRAIGSITGGAVVFYIVRSIKRFEYKTIFYVIARILELFILITALWMIFSWDNQGKDIVIVFMLYLLEIIGFLYRDDKMAMVVNNKYTHYLNDLMFPVYLNHMFVLKLFDYLGKTESLLGKGPVFATIITLLATIVISVITKEVLRRLDSCSKRLCHAIKC